MEEKFFDVFFFVFSKKKTFAQLTIWNVDDLFYFCLETIFFIFSNHDKYLYLFYIVDKVRNVWYNIILELMIIIF